MIDGRRGKIEERKRRLFMETYIICVQVQSMSIPGVCRCVPVCVCVCVCVALSVHLCVCM